MEQLLKWLATVSCMGSPEQKGWSYLRPLVFLVGTHADRPYEDIRNVQVKIWKEISQTNFRIKSSSLHFRLTTQKVLPMKGLSHLS